MNEMRERFDKRFDFVEAEMGEFEKIHYQNLLTFMEEEATRAAEAMRQRCEELVEQACDHTHNKYQNEFHGGYDDSDALMQREIAVADCRAAALKALRALIPISTNEERHNGSWVRAQREAANVSLREAARRMKISASYLSDIELGRRNVSGEVVNFIESLNPHPHHE